MERRDVLKIARFITLPLVFNKYSNPSIVYAEDKSKSLEDLRDEAYRIIEIIDAQKDSLNLPVLGADSIAEKRQNNENNYVTKKEAKNISEKEDIKNTLDIILTDFKNNGKDKPETALKTLQSYCSDSNVIKNKDASKLKELFADGKYGILLGKFDNYYITSYNKMYDTDVNETYYEVNLTKCIIQKSPETLVISFIDGYLQKEMINICSMDAIFFIKMSNELFTIYNLQSRLYSRLYIFQRYINIARILGKILSSFVFQLCKCGTFITTQY
jgi:hypothetical protein